MTRPNHSGGYYDLKGQWHRRKFCHRDCGARCNCKPPGGKWYDPRLDERLEGNQGER